jgi:hypothetical protein
LLTPYKYKFDEERQAIVFITDNGIHYEIDITDVSTHYFSNHPSIRLACYDISLTIVNSVKSKNDPRVCLTVIDIVKKILTKGNIIVFTCDSADKRQKTRHRLFNQWFKEYGDNFEKHDIKIEDDMTCYYLSLIINPKQQDSLFIQKIFQNSINEYLIYKHNS